MKVTEAETTVDLGALADRLRKALHEAEVLGLQNVVGHVEAALDAALAQGARGEAAAGQAPEAKSIGQHEPKNF